MGIAEALTCGGVRRCFDDCPPLPAGGHPADRSASESSAPPPGPAGPGLAWQRRRLVSRGQRNTTPRPSSAAIGLVPVAVELRFHLEGDPHRLKLLVQRNRPRAARLDRPRKRFHLLEMSLVNRRRTPSVDARAGSLNGPVV